MTGKEGFTRLPLAAVTPSQGEDIQYGTLVKNNHRIRVGIRTAGPVVPLSPELIAAMKRPEQTLASNEVGNSSRHFQSLGFDEDSGVLQWKDIDGELQEAFFKHKGQIAVIKIALSNLGKVLNTDQFGTAFIRMGGIGTITDSVNKVNLQVGGKSIISKEGKTTGTLYACPSADEIIVVEPVR